MLNAYALLPEEILQNHKLVIANHSRELKEQAKKLALPGVVLLNGIENDDIAAVVQSAGALMLVSTFEGFGLPLVEAMAAGRACNHFQRILPARSGGRRCASRRSVQRKIHCRSDGTGDHRRGFARRNSLKKAERAPKTSPGKIRRIRLQKKSENAYANDFLNAKRYCVYVKRNNATK